MVASLMWNDVSRKLERVTWSNLCYAAVCVKFTFYEFVSKSVLCFAGAVHGLRLWVMTSTAATIWTNNRQRILCSQELTLSSYPLVEQVRSLLYSRGTSAGSLFRAMTSAAATIWTNNMQRILCSQELASFSHPSGPWLTWLLCCNKQWLGNTSHHVPCQSHPLAAIIVSPRSAAMSSSLLSSASTAQTGKVPLTTLSSLSVLSMRMSLLFPSSATMSRGNMFLKS